MIGAFAQMHGPARTNAARARQFDVTRNILPHICCKSPTPAIHTSHQRQHTLKTHAETSRPAGVGQRTGRHMTTSAQAHSQVATSPLIPHLLTLTTQATDQMVQLAMTMEAQVSVDEALEPEHPGEPQTELATLPRVQLGVIRRALGTELQLQFKALTQTTDALYICARRLAGEER
jgi:hypothetical protein